MKKVLTLMVAGILALSVQVSMAAVNAGEFSLSPLLGGFLFNNAFRVDHNAIVGGIRAGYNFTPEIGVEALFDYAGTDTRTTVKKDADMYRYGAEALYNFFPDTKLVPHVAAGAGAMNLVGGFPSNKTKAMFDYGIGLKYFLTDNVALRGDVRHVITKDADWRSNLEYMAGLYIPFGGVKPAVQAVEPPQEPVAQEEPLQPVAATEPTPEHFKYCITLHTEFDVNKADIKPEYRDEISKVGNFMKQYPTTTAFIEGHTDNVGDAEYNMQLSQRRAESVVNHLVETYGIDRSRLTARGYGMSKPVADNTSDAGKQANRRIEAIIDCAFDVKKVTPPDRLCVNLSMEFDTNKADIKAQYREEIAKVGDFMKQYPTTTAIIEGHTDNVGSYEYNMKLSKQRAENVVAYLVKNFGIEASRLEAKGYGYTRRIAYNSTPEGRQKNRRINAIIDCVIKK